MFSRGVAAAEQLLETDTLMQDLVIVQALKRDRKMPRTDV